MQKIFYLSSLVLLIVSIVVLGVFGLPLGIDFKGGSLMEIKFLPAPSGSIEILDAPQIKEILKEFELGSMSIQTSDGDALILRFREIDESIHKNILVKLNAVSGVSIEETRFDSVGPVIGKETTSKSIKAIIFVLVMIVVYVAFAFRKLSFPIKSWWYGIVALVTLFHDVLITLGVFSVYLYFVGGEVGVPFIAAVLTILGYSVNDTIVVFDRVRENLLKLGGRLDFDNIVVRSVKESLVRSVNTSLTTLFVLLAIFFFGGATIKDFVLVLIIGIIVGTYSSLAVAAPLLASWVRLRSAR